MSYKLFNKIVHLFGHWILCKCIQTYGNCVLFTELQIPETNLLPLIRAWAALINNLCDIRCIPVSVSAAFNIKCIVSMWEGLRIDVLK